MTADADVLDTELRPVHTRAQRRGPQDHRPGHRAADSTRPRREGMHSSWLRLKKTAANPNDGWVHSPRLTLVGLGDDQRQPLAGLLYAHVLAGLQVPRRHDHQRQHPRQLLVRFAPLRPIFGLGG